MTINNALLSVYPNQIISESVQLGSKLYLTMNHNDLARNWISYWVARGNTNEIIFKFDPSGCVYVYKGVTCNTGTSVVSDSVSTGCARILSKVSQSGRYVPRHTWIIFPIIRFSCGVRVTF